MEYSNRLMEDITFNCDGCGQHLVVNVSGVGLNVKCPKCQITLMIPQLDNEKEIISPPITNKFGSTLSHSEILKLSPNEVKSYAAIQAYKWARNVFGVLSCVFLSAFLFMYHNVVLTDNDLISCLSVFGINLSFYTITVYFGQKYYINNIPVKHQREHYREQGILSAQIVWEIQTIYINNTIIEPDICHCVVFKTIVDKLQEIQSCIEIGTTNNKYGEMIAHLFVLNNKLKKEYKHVYPIGIDYIQRVLDLHREALGIWKSIGNSISDTSIIGGGYGVKGAFQGIAIAEVLNFIISSFNSVIIGRKAGEMKLRWILTQISINKLEEVVDRI
jgi:hypothetical protein